MNHANRPAPKPEKLGRTGGQVAKDRLQEMGKTQIWLANQTGYNIRTVNKYLNSHSPLLSNLSITRKFCRHLKLTFDDLYGTGPRNKK